MIRIWNVVRASNHSHATRWTLATAGFARGRAKVGVEAELVEFKPGGGRTFGETEVAVTRQATPNPTTSTLHCALFKLQLVTANPSTFNTLRRTQEPKQQRPLADPARLSPKANASPPPSGRSP